MTIDRRIAAGLIALTGCTVVLFVADAGGPVRQLVALAFMLVGPGLALSLVMGPMAPGARFLVALAGSASIVALVSLVLLAAGSWSAGFGLTLLAAFVLTVSTRTLRRTALDPDDAPTAPTSEHHPRDLRPETARRTT